MGKKEYVDGSFIGVGVTGALRPWPFQDTDVRGVRGERRKFDSIVRGHHRRAASVALLTPRMCGECVGERRKFDSIGVGVTGAWHVRAHDSNVYVRFADGPPGEAAAPAATFGPGPGGDQSGRAGRADCGRQTEGEKGVACSEL